MSAADDLAQVTSFRAELVDHLNFIAENRGDGYMPPSTAVQRRTSESQSRLTREYARLYTTIGGAAGVAQMRTAIHGVLSQDVIRDAISRPDFPTYGELAEMAVDHVDTAIGRLQARVEREQRAGDPDRIYRLTSPVYWVRWTLGAIAGLLRTARGRMVAGLTGLAVLILAAIVSGVAQALAAKLLGP